MDDSPLGLMWSISLVVLTVFVTLRLTDWIAWSLVWVLSPVWIQLAIMVVVTLVAVIRLKKGNGNGGR